MAVDQRVAGWQVAAASVAGEQPLVLRALFRARLRAFRQSAQERSHRVFPHVAGQVRLRPAARPGLSDDRPRLPHQDRHALPGPGRGPRKAVGADAGLRGGQRSVGEHHIDDRLERGGACRAGVAAIHQVGEQVAAQHGDAVGVEVPGAPHGAQHPLPAA